MQNGHKKRTSHPQGVGTFWKADRFELCGESHRSRALAAVLADRSVAAGAPRLAVVNVHLEGEHTAALTRVKQLQGVLKELRGKHEHHGLVVAGDFNTELQSSACASYLAFDRVLPGTWDMGHPVPQTASELEGHGYESLASVYEPSSVGEAAWTAPLECERFTFCGTPMRPVDGLDQIWHSTRRLGCVARRALFTSEAQRLSILQSGLPTLENPSDHVPIGAAFRWAPASELTAFAPPAQPGQAAEPELSAEEALAEAAALLEACPFASPTQRAAFDAATAPVEGAPPKGRPPPEVIAALKARQAALKAVLEEAEPELRQMLERVLALRRKAKKRAGRKPT
eukprot:COSAG04_NODE_2966_length_3337_cov_173.410130_4_plen_342_part_00